MFHTNAPWNFSGYGLQAALFVPRIAALGHEIVLSCPYSLGNPPIEWEGFPVLGAVRDTAGNDVLVSHYDYFKADLIFTLCDVFGLLKCAENLRQANVAMWVPVDTNPAGEGDIATLRESGAFPVAMSRFGQMVLRNEGCDPAFVPHAVDSSVFCPGDPAPYRATVPGMTSESFVIGLVAMNRDPQRKGFAEQFMAFANFHARHPDSFLAVHSVPVANPGINLAGMAARLGISSALAWPDSYSYDLGLVSCEQMAAFYRGCDVVSQTSYGEGFGLAPLEAQAAGVPVIVTDASAQSELCGSGWTVSGTPFWANGHGGFWVRPDVDDIEQAYEAAWQAREDGQMPALQKAARDFALTYDVDRVFTQHMTPVLKELEERIS